MVGGTNESRIASVVMIVSSAPAAPSRCPVSLLVDEVGIWYARSSPSASFSAFVSAASPAGVEVPCAFT